MDFFNQRLLSKSMLSKVRIFQAFGHLLENDEFDSISVKQIYQAAHTGKTTFYAHFQDKYDIVQWFTNLFFDMGIARIGRTLTWEQGHRVSTTGFLKYQEMLRKAFQSMDYNGINSYSPRRREKNLFETLTKYHNIEITKPLRSQVVSLAVGETVCFRNYLSEEDNPDVDEIVECFMSIIPQQLYELTKEPAVSRKDNVDEEMLNVDFIAHMLSAPVDR